MRSRCVLLAVVAAVAPLAVVAEENPAQHPAHLTAELHVRGSVARGASAAAKSRIEPELEPESDEKFMHKDLPDDRRPRVYHKFGYPYPVIQDSEDYDKDYVEDKNDDGGYWTAQLKYDNTKNKLSKEIDALKEALAEMQKQKGDLNSAQLKEAEAEKAARAAEAHEKEMDGHHDSATDALNKIKKEVDGGADHVEGEVTDLEDCKKQLEEARRKLKALLEEKQGAGAKAASKEKEEEDAEEAEVGAEKEEEVAEQSVAEAQKEHDAALAHYQKQLKEVKVAEDELAKAALELKKRRSRSEDPDGGVYPLHQKAMLGGAQSTRALSLSLVAVIATATFLHLA